MISSAVCGCWPSKARRLRIRCTDSVIFSQDPLNGVYSGMMPWLKSHRTISGVECPARLSQIKSMRKGGSSSGSVIGCVSPSCHTSQSARLAAQTCSAVAVGSVARIVLSSSLSPGWSTALAVLVTPLTRTCPSAGWNKVSSLAVPLR